MYLTGVEILKSQGLQWFLKISTLFYFDIKNVLKRVVFKIDKLFLEKKG